MFEDTLVVRTIIGAAALMMLSSCCLVCGDSDAGPSRSCTVTLKYKGGKFKKTRPFIATGKASTRPRALENACKDYCYSADSAYDKAFVAWADQPANKRKKASYDKDPDRAKQWDIIGNQSMKRELKLCVDRCRDNAPKKKGGLRAKTLCTDPSKL